MLIIRRLRRGTQIRKKLEGNVTESSGDSFVPLSGVLFDSSTDHANGDNVNIIFGIYLKFLICVNLRNLRIKLLFDVVLSK